MEHPIIIDSYGKTQKVDKLSLARLIRSSAGKSRLAAAMAAPIRRQLNYQGIARRALNIQQLPAGALLYYNKDIDVSALTLTPTPKVLLKHNLIVINSAGKTGHRRFNAQRVIIPKFEVYSNPTVRISDVQKRRFNLIDRGAKVVPPSYRHNHIVINTKGKTLDRSKNRRRFPVIDRAVQKARWEIMAQEDAAIFAILDAASTNFDISNTTKENK